MGTLYWGLLIIYILIKIYSMQADPDNIDECANAVHRKFSKFADNFDTLK